MQLTVKYKLFFSLPVSRRNCIVLVSSFLHPSLIFRACRFRFSPQAWGSLRQ